MTRRIRGSEPRRSSYRFGRDATADHAKARRSPVFCAADSDPECDKENRGAALPSGWGRTPEGHLSGKVGGRHCLRVKTTSHTLRRYFRLEARKANSFSNVAQCDKHRLTEPQQDERVRAASHKGWKWCLLAGVPIANSPGPLTARQLPAPLRGPAAWPRTLGCIGKSSPFRLSRNCGRHTTSESCRPFGL